MQFAILILLNPPSSPDADQVMPSNEHQQQQHRHPLPRSVPAINDDISPRRVRTRVARQIDIGALELLGLGVAAERDHVMPDLLHLLVDKVGEARVDVAGGDAVDAGEVAPLVRQRLGQVDAAGLGDVVGRLLLRVVGDVAGHAGGDDEGARLALAEVQAHGAGAVEGARQVRRDDLVPRLDARVEDAGVGRPARVGDEDVDAAEVGDDGADQLLDVGVGAHVALVGFGLGAVLLLELLGVLDAAFGPGGVGDGDVGAHFGAPARGFGADAGGARGAGDDDDFAFEAEKLLEGVGFGGFDGHDGGWWEVDGGLL